jgi:hypothetical protein
MELVSENKALQAQLIEQQERYEAQLIEQKQKYDDVVAKLRSFPLIFLA